MAMSSCPLLLFAVLCCCVLIAAGASGARSERRAQLLAAKANPRESFTSWAKEMGKTYVEDAEEFERRFKIWLDNLEFILDYNEQAHSHWLGLNVMADLTNDEYKQRFLGTRVPEERLNRSSSTSGSAIVDTDLDDVPKAVDWRDHNAVTEVKNQESCGGCWAFSATGAVEGVNALFTGTLLSLSEQELIDCEKMDDGCDGGWMDDAFDFVESHGLTLESEYEYKAEDEKCKKRKEGDVYVTIDSYTDVEKSEPALVQAAAKQPVSVAIEADGRTFQLYDGGIYDDPCGTELDHGVLVVGYDLAGDGFWIVKNSWGKDWGEHGYIRMKMGMNDGEGECGITLASSFPVKTTPNPPPPSPSPSPGPTPPPPPPTPVICDRFTECPAGTTCCCKWMVLEICLMWSCCPYEDGTCCEDHEHCCPKDYPTCDASAKECVNPFNGYSIPWSSPSNAKRHWPWGESTDLEPIPRSGFTRDQIAIT